MNLYLVFITILSGLIFSGCSKSNAFVLHESLNTENKLPQPLNRQKILSAEKQVAKDPDKIDGYLKLSIAFIQTARETGDFSLNANAEKAIENALKIEPENQSALKLKASLHLTFHRFAEALSLGKELQTKFPNDAFVYGVLTDANVELGNYQEAIENTQKMVDLKPNTASFARIANLRSLNGDHIGAVEMYKTAARTADPTEKETQSWCLVQLGDELLKNGKFAEAEVVFDEALQNFPGYYLAISGKGKVRAALGDFENAVKLLTDANNRVPNVENAILLGDIYSRQDEFAKANEQYDLVELIEQKISVNNDQKRLALLWLDQNIRLEEALAITKREFETRKDIFTADALAWAYYKNGLLTEAGKTIAKAMNPKSNDARILYHAGMIEKALGNKPAAKKFLQTAIYKNPKFDLIQNGIAETALAELK